MGGKKKKKVEYYTPFYMPKPYVEPIDESDLIGAPGTIDLDGVWIPKKKVAPRPVPVPPVPGKIHVAMRRSFYSGKFHSTRASLKRSEVTLRCMCSNPRVIENVYKILMQRDFEVDPVKQRAQKKYRAYRRKIGADKRSKYYLKEFSEGFLAVNGVMAIRKVLKQREKFHKDEETIVPMTGVVVKGTEDND